jgi:signal transduction histidine kinase
MKGRQNMAEMKTWLRPLRFWTRDACSARRKGVPLALLSGCALSCFSLEQAAAQSPDLPLLHAMRFDPNSAFGFALLMGLLIFSTTTALLHILQRRKWTEREQDLAHELADLRGAHDRAEWLIGAERQLVMSWAGRDGKPRFEGDLGAAGEGISNRNILAFGSWLITADATRIETALEKLKERGENFRFTLKTIKNRFVEAEGRTVTGQAVLRLRDVTGDRLELLRAQDDLSQARIDVMHYRGLLDALPQPAWLRSLEGRLLWANPAYLNAVEALDLSDAQSRDLQLLDRAVREEMTKKRDAKGALKARVAAVMAGARRMLDITESPINGGTAGLAIDVSELEDIRSNLQRQMQAHVRTLDQLPTAVAIFDDRQKLVFHNAAYRQLWSLDQSFLGANPTDNELLDHLRDARKLPEQADFKTWKTDILSGYRAVEPRETWWYLPDRRTLRVVMNPNPQGGVTYLFDDVSESIDLRSQYNALMRVQGETLDTLKEGVAVFGSDGRLKLSNPAFCEMWRLSPDFAKEQPHIDAMIERCQMLTQDESAWNDVRGAVVGVQDARTGLSCRMNRRDGLVLDCAAQPLPDGATLITFVDMTASVNVERALTEKNEALEKASQLRDDFVHHVSYELRSPLTNIIGFAQLLSDETVGALNKRQSEYTGHIMRSSGALLAIINDILDLATIDNGAMELTLEDVDIRATIDASVKGLADRLAESNITLTIDTPASIGSFKADGQRIRQILFNLLSNAIGFSNAGQTITLKARKKSGKVMFTITDQGRGIPDEVREKVFERFETHTQGTRHRGVGLGLSMVRSFVELHGGYVTLSSSPGSGTKVTCAFPADGQSRLVAA